MPNDDLTYLVELANKATRGIWIAVGRWVENVHDDLPDIVTTTEDRGPNDSDKQQCADAAYIAAVNPSAVKRLIDEIRSLRAVVQAGAEPPTADEVDDMAFGYCPSGNIGELRDLIHAVQERLGIKKENGHGLPT